MYDTINRKKDPDIRAYQQAVLVPDIRYWPISRWFLIYEPLLCPKPSFNSSCEGEMVPDIRVKIKKTVPDVRNTGLLWPQRQLSDVLIGS